MMKMLARGIATLLLTFSMTAQAEIVFNFDIDPADFVDSYADFGVFQAGDTLTIAFDDGTDLYNISYTDIAYYKYNIAAVATGTALRGGGWSAGGADIGNDFNFDGSNLTLTMRGGYSPDAYIVGYDEFGYGSQIRTGGAYNYYTAHASAGGYGSSALSLASGNSVVIGSNGTAVPAPAPLILLGMGLIALGFGRRQAR